MALLIRNLIFNFAGKFSSIALNLLITPYCINKLGIEAYGLIGFFILLLNLCTIFDAGLGFTVNKELAQQSVSKDNNAHIAEFLKTTEYIYWFIAVFLGVIICCFSPYISLHWLQIKQLSNADVKTCIFLMGWAIAFQWPSSLYSSGLLGLQLHDKLNIALTSISLLRALGIFLIYEFGAPSVVSFFYYQAMISLLQSILYKFLLWKYLPKCSTRPRFNFALLSKVWNFALGASGIGILSMILINLDKVILSKKISLDHYGCYSLACNIASSLYLIITPLFSTFFPKYSQIFALNDLEKLKAMYHKTNQLMSALVFPAALTIALFSQEILSILTKDTFVKENTYILASCLTIGTMFNALMNFPFALQLASGWTRLALIQNTISVIVLVPILFFCVDKYGVQAAPLIWVIHNLACIFCIIPLVHRKLLSGELKNWYIQDNLLPFLTTLTAVLLAKYLIPKSTNSLFLLFYLFSTVCFSFIISLNSTKLGREMIKQYFSKLQPS